LWSERRVEGIGGSMTEGRLIEGLLNEASRGKGRLSLEEVLQAGLPAVYQQYGDRLLCLDGRVFDAADPGALAEIALIATGAATRLVGVEFGWRHAGDCPCHFCSKRAADRAA
jgi:hypothetical protein